MSARIAFGLGGNLGDVGQSCKRATTMLGELPMLDASSMCTSPFYASDALLEDGAPEAWNQPFINQVVTYQLIGTPEPQRILRETQRIEQQLGKRKRGHWAPREIDIDIIAIEGITLTTDTLALPHPHAHSRAFVVLPLNDIWPECVLACGNQARHLARSHIITQQPCELL